MYCFKSARRCAFLLWVAALLCGCGGGALPPLTLAELPAALQKAFATGSEDNRALISGVVKQVEHQQFAPASFQLQNLLNDRGLSKDQKETVARALIVINSNLQKQVDVQEAAVAPASARPGRSESVSVDTSANAAPAADPAAAAEAATLLHIHRRTK